MSQRNAKIRGLQLGTMPPERAIPYLLKSLHHVLRQAVEESMRLQRLDMSFAHFVALYMLESEPGIAGAEIARRGFVTAQTMNTILRRLEQDGDVERRPNPGNSRADSWYISAAGQRRLEQAKIMSELVWAQLLSALQAGEVKQLQQLLQKCIQGFNVTVNDTAATSAVAVVKRRPASGSRSARSTATARRSRG